MFGELNILTTLVFILFTIGLIGVIANKNNILIMLLCLEILILAINLNFITLSVYLDDIIGQIITIFVLAIAAAESALGLALITCLYQLKNSIEIKGVINKKNNKI
jgi:NADH-quinone oxidoreductase subunit K